MKYFRIVIFFFIFYIENRIRSFFTHNNNNTRVGYFLQQNIYSQNLYFFFLYYSTGVCLPYQILFFSFIFFILCQLILFLKKSKD